MRTWKHYWWFEAVRPAPRVCEAGSGHAMHCLICAYIGFIFTRAEHKCSVSERVIQGPLPSRDDI